MEQARLHQYQQRTLMGDVGCARLSRLWVVAVWLCLLCPCLHTAEAQEQPLLDVILAADKATVWNENQLRFFLVQGDCLIEQGLYRLRCDECLAWINETSPAGQPVTIGVVASGNVRLQSGSRRVERFSHFETTLQTNGTVELKALSRTDSSGASHPLYAQAVKRLPQIAPLAADGSTPVEIMPATAEVAVPENTGDVVAVQFVTPETNPQDPVVLGLDPDAGGIDARTPAEVPATQGSRLMPSAIVPDVTTGVRRIRFTPRSSQDFQSNLFNTNDGQRILLLTGGIRIIVEEVDTGDVVSVVADRAVIWTRGDLPSEFGGPQASETSSEQPVEFYLEGNVFIRQGNLRSVQQSNTYVMSGKQIYYNVNTKRALILDGSVETYDDKFRTPLLMTASEIRQLSADRFFANSASFTTSPYRGTPGYEFTANEMYFEEVKTPITNPFTGNPVINTQTGEPLIRTEHYATGYSNILRISDIPVFYWPYIRADVEDPLGPLEDFQIGNTDNLGFTTTVALDVWQLLGLDYLPIADQSNWLLDLGYHSKRGVAGGSRFDYFGSELFGLRGRYFGNTLAWGILDDGVDYLGLNRQGLAPPRNTRGRFRFQHRHDLPPDKSFIVEFSHLSDANLLESFFEAEYDNGKDQETLFYFKQARGNGAWTALVQPRVNGFLPQNQWLPRLDGYLLGVPLLENRLTYFQHSSVAYGSLLPPDTFVLPTDQAIDIARVDSRHEINLPMELGPWQFTPFAIGQLSAYSDTPTAEGLGRAYGAGGVRTSLPFWKLYPGVESQLLNLSGLAHKVAVNADYFYARSNRDFTELPLMDQLDDDTSELVRRQNLLRQFGGVVPLRYDPRFIALRRNLGYHPEILDDMQNFRLGLSQKLQTKRGPIGKQHIIDWMTLDIGASVFPEDERDNLGELFGLIDYHYEWHIGDRTTVASTLLHEPFDDTLSVTSALYAQRPPRNTLGIFYSHFASGPFESNYVGFSTSYRFSNKYAGSIQTGVDLEAPDNMSYEVNFTRVGLDFLVTVGVVYNAGRDDFGFRFNIVPRVQARTTFNRTPSPTLPFGVDPSESPILNTEDRLSILNNNFTTN